MKRLNAATLFILIFFCHFVLCEDEPLRLSSDLWVGYSPWAIAANQKLFQEEGVNVELRVFSELIDSKKAFEAGNIDMVSLTLHELFLLRDKGIDAVAILILDYSAGADAVVSQSKISSLKDLKGKKIGAEVGTVSHFTLLKALEKGGLKETDISLINLGSSSLEEAFRLKKVDAVATWEPYVSELVKKDEGKVIYSSREIPGTIVDVLVVKRDLIKKRKTDLTKVCRSWFKALDFYSQAPQRALKIMSKVSGTTPQQHQKQLEGVFLADRSFIKNAFGSPKNKGTLEKLLSETGEFLRKNKLIQSNFDPSNFYDAEVIKNDL